MMKIKATRMELLKLKKQLKVAERGYNLLKEKRDGLVRKFMEIIKKAKEKREIIEKELSLCLQNFSITSSLLAEKELEQIFALGKVRIDLKVEKENVMAVWLPKFKAEILPVFEENKTIECYSPISVPLNFDKILKKLSQEIKNLLTLAQLEHSANLLSKEIEKVRQRVNALEYLIIPKIKQKIKYIEQKLEAREREEKIFKMKIKKSI